jgi:hypothetical protein
MLFAACATTRPTIARARRPQSIETEPVSRASPMASSPPTSPDVTVIEKTAARVITSHLLRRSGGLVMPTGRFAVLNTVRHVRSRSWKDWFSIVAEAGVTGVAMLRVPSGRNLLTYGSRLRRS